MKEVKKETYVSSLSF